MKDAYLGNRGEILGLFMGEFEVGGEIMLSVKRPDTYTPSCCFRLILWEGVALCKNGGLYLGLVLSEGLGTKGNMKIHMSCDGVRRGIWKLCKSMSATEDLRFGQKQQVRLDTEGTVGKRCKSVNKGSGRQNQALFTLSAADH